MTRSATQQIGPDRPMPERVLVLGSTGMVGRSWVAMLERMGIEHRALSRPAFDLSDPESVDRAFDQPFDLVVNAAAWTDVDGAEDDEAGATRANAYAVEQIARRCAESGAVLITYSTDYVFNGRGESPYPVDAPVDPINAYGRSKALGESLLRRVSTDHLLIRTSWVYAPWGKNFVRTMMKLTREREALQVVDDQRGRPTSAPHLAEGSLTLYQAGATGTWHLTDSGECSWHRLACAVRDALDTNCTIEACSSNAFPRPAVRPAYSTLDISATEAQIGPIGSWETRVRSVIAGVDAPPR